MLGWILKKIIGTQNERELRRLIPIVEKINALEPGIQKLSDQELRNRKDRWWNHVKASELLERLFESYFDKLKLPNLMSKSNYHLLARYIPKELISDEIVEKLDAILSIAEKIKPL